MIAQVLQAASRLGREERGSALVEFAASGTMLVLVLFGIMDTARALYVDNFVANAAREGARYAMVRGNSWSGTSCAAVQTDACMATATDVTNYIDSMVPAGVSTSSNYLTVTTTWPGTTPAGNSCTTQGTDNAVGCVVQVKVAYSFNFVFSFLPKGALALSSTSAVAIAQ